MFSLRNLLIGVTSLAVILGGTLLLRAESTDAIDPPLPLANTSYVLGDAIADYADFMMSGGPPPDGIPSIDEPDFIDADAADLDDGDMVIGYEHNGDARAYPQLIMVHHEIVNDEVGGFNVAITYCPLTATSQGFARGETTLGVSGQLLNSNLVMFDRDTESYFSQINATGLTGAHAGETLDEVNLIWTTWGEWKATHPSTQVLSDDTGHLRNYNNDPYGDYNPAGGYYTSQNVMFPLMHESNAHHTKEMIVGARTADESVYAVMETLAEERVQQSDGFVAVYDQQLDTGYIYATESPDAVSANDDGSYTVDGASYAADALPFDKLVSVEAFHFAWHAFYPDSTEM